MINPSYSSLHLSWFAFFLTPQFPQLPTPEKQRIERCLRGPSQLHNRHLFNSTTYHIKEGDFSPIPKPQMFKVPKPQQLFFLTTDCSSPQFKITIWCCVMKLIALVNSIFQPVLVLCSYNFIVFACDFELLSPLNFWLVFIKLMQREKLNFSF